MAIPRIVFFVYLGAMQFSLVQYLAVRSAWEVNRPDELRIYCEHPPEGQWWDLARAYVTSEVAVDPPSVIDGHPISHPAQQCDLQRLLLLKQHGGIYLDLDVICVRPLDGLLNYDCVLGQEGINGKEGLCNGVILARPESVFISEWIRGFDPRSSHWMGFRSEGHDQYWDELSVQYPAYLAEIIPHAVHVEAHDSFHWPVWYDDHLVWFFEHSGDTFPNAYCHHLWQSTSWDRYLSRLTPEYIGQVDTNFNRIARRFLP